MEPTTKLRVTPKDFFLWLGSMAALYVSIVSILTLYFQYINYLFPDALNSYVDPYSSTIRFAIASVVVATPLYIYLTRMVNSEIRATPEKRDLWVRRWLIYITLFVGGLTLAIDLIVLINTFLGGDITMRFVLKVVAVFLVVTAFFWYYISDLRGVWERNAKLGHMLGWVMGGIVVLSIAGGFLITGSPFDQRLYRFDEQKTADLQNIQYQVVNYYQQKGSIPNTLVELHDPISGNILPLDPQTGAEYSYTKKGALEFSLCTTFNKESRPTDPNLTRPVAAMPIKGMPGEVGIDLYSLPWTHGVGEVCFDRTIDPDRYPLYTK